MAYHYAVYVEQVVKAGKAEYPLPLYAYAWQDYADGNADKTQLVVLGGRGQPGDCLSGDGLINALDVGHFCAPH